jgi:D-alanyl-D-alanine carboxypeptidase (penicillin-binding protein 5/6)
VATAANVQSTPPAAVPPPAIAAKAYFLLDVLSGEPLVAQNADEPREPASLTKLMTAYLTFQALRDKALIPSQMVTVSEKAWRAEGSRMFIEPKKAVSVDELLRGEIVQSGNDAAIALAEAVAGSEPAFVERMNKEAARLGMSNTHFVNATGLSAPQQVSTAADLARIATAIIRDFPEYYPLYSIKEYRYNHPPVNRNRRSGDPYVDGMKTGFTDAAGYCLVASAKRGPAVLSLVISAGSEASRKRVAEAPQLRVPVLRYRPALPERAVGSSCDQGVEGRRGLGVCGLHRRSVRDVAERPGAEAQAHA